MQNYYFLEKYYKMKPGAYSPAMGFRNVWQFLCFVFNFKCKNANGKMQISRNYIFRQSRGIERSPCETPIHASSGISCFWKRGGSPYLSAVRFWTLQNLMDIWSLKLWQKGSAVFMNWFEVDVHAIRPMIQGRLIESISWSLLWTSHEALTHCSCHFIA